MSFVVKRPPWWRCMLGLGFSANHRRHLWSDACTTCGFIGYATCSGPSCTNPRRENA